MTIYEDGFAQGGDVNTFQMNNPYREGTTSYAEFGRGYSAGVKARMEDALSSDPKVTKGTPVWVSPEHGWCLYRDQTLAGFVVIDVNGQTLLTSAYSLEAPPRAVKESSFTDNDGNEFVVSFGEYETDIGREMIFGIDGPIESLSFSANDLTAFVEAVKKVM